MSGEVSTTVEETLATSGGDGDQQWETAARPALAAAARPALAAAKVLSVVALLGIAITVGVFTALHLLPPTSEISPVSRTISEYALTSSAWAFNLGVITLAGATVALLAALVLIKRIRLVSGGTVFGALWTAGLLTLVSFPKHNWALGGASNSGQIHRMASLVAFVALPIAVLVIARRHRMQPQPASARWAIALGVLSLLWFTPLLYAIVTAPRAWWQQIPLGLIERGMALTEVAALVLLALLVRRSVRVPTAATQGAAVQTAAGPAIDPGRTDPHPG